MLPFKKKRFMWLDLQEEHDRLYKDYFTEYSIYNEIYFQHRFRMCKCLFLCIIDTLRSRFEHFQLRYDGLGRLTKCTTALRMLAYGISAYCVDKYLKIRESTTMDCMKNFAPGIIQAFREEYSRKPTKVDVDSLWQVEETHDFSSMLGSINYMHSE